MVYIIKSESELRIVTVQPEHANLFLQEFENQIIVSDTNVPEALTKFHELPLVFAPYP